jgi:hypothetical protein
MRLMQPLGQFFPEKETAGRPERPEPGFFRNEKF